MEGDYNRLYDEYDEIDDNHYGDDVNSNWNMQYQLNVLERLQRYMKKELVDLYFD